MDMEVAPAYTVTQLPKGAREEGKGWAPRGQRGSAQALHPHVATHGAGGAAPGACSLESLRQTCLGPIFFSCRIKFLVDMGPGID